MLSRITIEINFDEGNLPIIQVINQQSDDVRDKLLTNFLQSVGHTSRWCRLLYMGNISGLEHFPTNKWHIVPITPKDLKEEIDLMQMVYDRWNDSPPIEAPIKKD